MQPRLQSASLLPSPRASINYRFILVPDGPAAYAVEKTIRAVCRMAEIKSQFGATASKPRRFFLSLVTPE
jgi:hypothetical protein